MHCSQLKCALVPTTESEYISQTSARIVQMFQLYVQNINPESEHFLAFITKYLKTANVTSPRAVPYPELYQIIKKGIREYLRQQGSLVNQKESDQKSR
jgi:hypothetical protein